MSTFRVPFPREPERRQRLFERSTRTIAPFGTHTGTPEEGQFQGQTPLGEFAGTYRVDEETCEIEIEIIKRPSFVSMGMIEAGARQMILLG